jgi:hypothetical protein
MSATKPCKECVAEGVTTRRPTPHPGPRCATHHRRIVRARRVAAHDGRVRRTYGLEPGEYERMWARQGGRCAICQRATGKVRRLAVDHCHETGRVRGLLCGPCNQFVGYLRDAPEAFRRGADYLEDK